MLSYEVQVRISPNTPEVRSILGPKLSIDAQSIGTSTRTWSKTFAAGSGSGGLTYDSGRQVWVTTLTYTGLPANNSDFGKKYLSVTSYGRSNAILPRNFMVLQNQDFEAFFPRDATNNPGGTAENWFYYWNQTAAGDPNAVWMNDARTQRLYGNLGTP